MSTAADRPPDARTSCSFTLEEASRRPPNLAVSKWPMFCMTMPGAAIFSPEFRGDEVLVAVQDGR
jgi:hypothetical protein